jgi:hypothetical protein
MRLKRAIPASLVLFGLSGVGIGMAQFQASTVVRQVSGILSNIPEISAGKITVHPWLGQVEIEAAVRADAATTVRVGKVTFAAPSATGAFGISPAIAWDGTMTFQNVSADLGIWHVDVPSIVISGTRASKSDIAALFDAKSTTPMVEKLAKFNAKAIDIPTVTLRQSGSLGSTGTTNLRSISARDIQGGRIASITMAMADMQSKVELPPNDAASGQWGAQPSSMDVKGSYGPTTITNLNLAAILRMMTEIGKGDATPATLYDQYVIDHFNVSMSWPAARLEVAGAAGSGAAKGRPLRYPLTDLMKIAQKRKAGLDPSPQDNAEMFRRTADLFTAFQVSTEVKDVTYQLVGPQETVAGKLAKISVSFGDDGTLREGVEGFTLDGGGLHVGLGRLGYSIALGSSMQAVAEATWQVSQNPQPSAQGMAEAFAKISDVLMAFQAATELQDLAVKVDVPDHKIDGKIDGLAFSVGQNATIHAGLEGFAFEGEGVHANVGRIGLNGELGSAIRALAQSATRGEGGIASANPRSFVPHLSNFIMSDIDMNAPAPKKDGNADGGNRIALGLNRFEISSSNIVENIPTAVSLVLDHFRFELPKSDPGLNELIAMGYSKVDLSSAIDLAWNEATRQVAINKLAVSDPELGVIGVNGVIDNVSKALFNGNKTEVQAAAMAAAVKAVDIKIENKGLYEKLIAEQARDQKKSPDDIRAYAAKMAAFVVLYLLGDTPREHAVAEAVSTFMADPKSLHVVARSPEGLPPSAFINIQDPTQLMRNLEVRAIANE